MNPAYSPGRVARLPALVALLGLVVASRAAQQGPSLPPPLPSGPDAVRFAVIGDSGTGRKAQYEVAARLADYHRHYPFDFVIMLGDNMYGSQRPEDFVKKFERPYAPLLEAGVKFYAALGNHDNPPEVNYKPFNMDGRNYYTFTKGSAQFFVLDSNYMDPKQLAWVEQELKASNKRWKIAYFHHPLYSSGKRHGSETDLRALLEPLLVQHGVDVVFAGHEHFYERVKPQKGIAYFTQGGSAKLRRGNIRQTALTEKGFDTDRSFMVVAIDENGLHFQAISRTGTLVDSGIVLGREALAGAAPSSTIR